VSNSLPVSVQLAPELNKQVADTAAALDRAKSPPIGENDH
jgi:hypothetical protein